ncbi:cutinase family protein [Nocardia sp. NPDC004068]|uniref:cutinase family protein n=1 Tax=Nocardia sp. NPDC004068 TaxID=3364303 RepID=UPI0036C38F3A
MGRFSRRNRWKANAALGIAALLVGAAQVGGAGASRAAPAPGCPDLYVVAVPGTWETSNSDPGRGILAVSADGLPGNVRVDYVSYAATAFPWEGDVYGRSKQEAVEKARNLVAAMGRACGATRIALLGYSQGADAAGDVAAEIGTGLGVVPADRVVLVGLISDPRRSPTDNLIGPPVPGAGAVGPRPGGFGWVSGQTYTFCVAGDLYCSMPDGDFAGRIAGFFVQLSNPDAAQLGRYQQEAGDLFGDAMRAGGLGLLSDQLNANAYEERQHQIDQFLQSGVHQSYPGYIVAPGNLTPLTWLRQRLIDAARSS